MCVPSCQHWSPHEEATSVALDLFATVCYSLGALFSVVALVVSIKRREAM